MFPWRLVSHIAHAVSGELRKRRRAHSSGGVRIMRIRPEQRAFCRSISIWPVLCQMCVRVGERAGLDATPEKQGPNQKHSQNVLLL